MRKLQEFRCLFFICLSNTFGTFVFVVKTKFFSVFVSPFKVHEILNWRASEVRGKFGRFLSNCAFCESSSDEIN